LTRKIDRQPTSDQPAADQRSRCQCKAGAGGPDTDRTAALLFVGIGMAEQCQRIRNQHGRTEALNRSCRDQDEGIGRQRASHRRCRENGKTRHEHPLGADTVSQRARGENEGGKRDGVGADHPLQFGNATAERGADAAERGVDDGDVELNHAVAKAHGRQRQRFQQVRARRLVCQTRHHISIQE
jgi:hypothetical protein